MSHSNTAKRAIARPLVLKAYAKVNVGLVVAGRRGDGYHELRTVYQCISLADELEISIVRGAPGVKLELSGIEAPPGRENLAVRAAEAVMAELKLKRQVTLKLHKRIPAGSGLGGASSDAAAVIRALSHLAPRPLDPQRSLALASALGSDVPFFLFGGRALGVGRGEETYPLPDGPRRWCVVVFPGASISTAHAYQQLGAPLLTSPGAAHTIEMFCADVNRGAWPRLGNDFERVAFAAIPELARIKQSLHRAGAEFASLSGSGSAVFGLFAERRRALTAAADVRQPGRQVFLSRTVSRAEFSRQIGECES